MLEKIINKSVGNEHFEKIKEFSSFFLIPNLFPYIMPLVHANNKKDPTKELKEELENKKYSREDNELYTFGLTLGLTGFGLQAYMYSQNPELLSVPILANVCSGIYEFRKNNNKILNKSKYL